MNQRGEHLGARRSSRSSSLAGRIPENGSLNANIAREWALP
jgi:hypothetical protein